MIGGKSKEKKVSKLIGQGAYGCVYHPAITCSGKTSTSQKYITKLVVDDENARKEIMFGKLVSKIRNFKKFFSPVVKTCLANLKGIRDPLTSGRKQSWNGEGRSSPLDGCEVVDRFPDSSFLLTYVDFIDGSILGEYFYLLPYDKEFFSHIRKSYSYLINSLQILYTNGIIHYDLKSDNIMFDELNNIPIIIDFGLSIQVRNIIIDDKGDDKIISQYKNSFFTYAPDYDVWCPEINVICFILYRNYDNEAKFLTLERLHKVLEDCIYQNSVLEKCSHEFRERYYKAVFEFMKPLVGKDNIFVIRELISYRASWDLYSLAICFIKMIIRHNGYGNVGDGGRDLFFDMEASLMQSFFLSISPDPRKRPTFEVLKRSGFQIRSK